MNGSIGFYKRQESVENGEGVTFKKIIFDYNNQQVILRSLNKKHPSFITGAIKECVKWP